MKEFILKSPKLERVNQLKQGVELEDRGTPKNILEEGIPRDRRGRMLWSLVGRQPQEIRVAMIEFETRQLLDSGVLLIDKVKKPGFSNFSNGIRNNYPGGMAALREKLNLPLRQIARNYWKDPQVIESEAKRILETGGNLTQNGVKKAKKSSLWWAIGQYYPGGIHGLREKIGIFNSQKPSGYWTPSNIEAEAKGLLTEQGQFSYRFLSVQGRTDLIAAIQKKYPGGMHKLRQKLGLEVIRRPRHYWSSQVVEEEARKFLEENSILSQVSLARAGRYELINAMHRHYPGGIRRLRQRLGVQHTSKPQGYWTVERIEGEARTFFQEQGSITQKLLHAGGRSDLITAISRNYPGGLAKVKEVVGIEQTIKPHGYWQIETIEEEALNFFRSFGELRVRTLKRNNHGLLSAIQQKYPGGMKELKEKLGIETKDPGRNMLYAYEEALSQGHTISFEEFVRRIDTIG